MGFSYASQMLPLVKVMKIYYVILKGIEYQAGYQQFKAWLDDFVENANACSALHKKILFEKCDHCNNYVSVEYKFTRSAILPFSHVGDGSVWKCVECYPKVVLCGPCSA